MPGSLLMVFVKNPEKGKVKTRLAKTLGNEAAYWIYLVLLDHTHKISADSSLYCDKVVFYSNHIEKKDLWDSGNFIKKIQEGSGLGERMYNAFRWAFSQGYNKVVVIGSDCTEIHAGIIRQAFHELSKHDLVIGPAKDGGYYLLGMKEVLPFLFEDMPWSTDQLLQETLRVINSEGKAYTLLKELSDVDQEDDLRTFKNNLI